MLDIQMRQKNENEDLKSEKSSVRSKGQPVLFIDVNLGKDKGMHRLIIRENDDPKRMAGKFAQEH